MTIDVGGHPMPATSARYPIIAADECAWGGDDARGRPGPGLTVTKAIQLAIAKRHRSGAMPPLKDEVWPKVLRENAIRVIKIDA
jgi:hypothetical protein